MKTGERFEPHAQSSFHPAAGQEGIDRAGSFDWKPVPDQALLLIPGRSEPFSVTILQSYDGHCDVEAANGTRYFCVPEEWLQ